MTLNEAHGLDPVGIILVKPRGEAYLRPMPYIPPQDRPTYDPLIAPLAEALRAQQPDRRKGHANYVITQIMRKAWGVDRAENESYSNYADIIGTLECAKQELYRRWVADYEDKAIAKHGDL